MTPETATTGHLSRRKTASSTGSAIQFKGATDQFGHQWIVATKGETIAAAPLEQLLRSPGEFYTTLANRRVAISTSTTRARLNACVESSGFDVEIHVVDRNGWHGDDYLKPDCKTPKKFGGKLVVDARPSAASAWETLGSMETWVAKVKRLVRGQPILIFSMCCGFASLAEHLLPTSTENVLVELVGPSSIGKTTALHMVGSVFGGKDYAKSWHTTVAGLETVMAASGHALLLLDEAGHFSQSGLGAADRMAQSILMLADGTAKSRFGSSGTKRTPLVVLSTSNQSIATVLRRHDPEIAKAVQVRLLSINADAGRGLGILDHLPRGCVDASDAIRQLSALTEQHHGHAAVAFVNRLEAVLADPDQRAALAKKVESRVRKFHRELAVDPADGQMARVADKFARLYAAGLIAKDFGLLPIKSIGLHLANLFMRNYPASAAPASVSLTAVAKLNAYYRHHRREFVDLNSGTYASLSNAEIDQGYGFDRTESDGSKSLNLTSKAWGRLFGTGARDALNEFDKLGLLIAKDGKQRQIKVRANQAKDRVYSVRIGTT